MEAKRMERRLHDLSLPCSYNLSMAYVLLEGNYGSQSPIHRNGSRMLHKLKNTRCQTVLFAVVLAGTIESADKRTRVLEAYSFARKAAACEDSDVYSPARELMEHLSDILLQ